MQDFKVFIPFLVLTLLALFVLSKRPVGVVLLRVD